MEVSGDLTPRSVYSRYPLSWTPGGFHIRSERFGLEDSPLPLSGMELAFSVVQNFLLHFNLNGLYFYIFHILNSG
jgi:hypothetical protein